MDELNLIETDAGLIYQEIIGILEENVSETLYPGDERLLFGEALVAVIVAVYNTVNDRCRQRMIRFARGVVLDALGERMQTPRLQPNKATTTMRFIATQPDIHNNIIPSGTRVTADSELYYEVISTVVLHAGDSFIDVEVVAQEGGAKYNGYSSGTITTLVDQLPFIKSVTNLTTTSGGDDGEAYNTDGDDRYRVRILLAPETLSAAGTEGRYAYYALSADPSIIDVRVITPAPGRVTVIPLLQNGDIPDSAMLDKILNVVGDRAVRAFTDLVNVEPPATVPYDINLTYYTTSQNLSTVTEMVEASGGAIDKYIEWQSQELGRLINPDKLRSLILAPEGRVGADRIDIISPAFIEVPELSVAQFSGNKTVNVVVRG